MQCRAHAACLTLRCHRELPCCHVVVIGLERRTRSTRTVLPSPAQSVIIYQQISGVFIPKKLSLWLLNRSLARLPKMPPVTS